MARTIEPCLGIPVYYDPELKVIADSSGVWRWKKIVVGPDFFRFPPREQGALLLHEAGHCKLGHVAKLALFIARSPRRIFRILMLAVRSSSKGTTGEFHASIARDIPELAEYRKRQELQADNFASSCGYGHDLARAFARMQGVETAFYPPRAERILRLISKA